jgi:putative flippase GtrA
VNRLVQSEPADGSDASLAFGSTQPMAAVRSSGELAAARYPRTPSYHPTRSPALNRALDVVDRIIPGKAGVFQRLFSYLFIGGIAALINLGMLKLMLILLERWPTSEHFHFIVASAVAYEVSILANFIPNDYFTFRHLSGHGRRWIARAARFHITSIGGILVTFTIAAVVHYGFKVDAFWAQAIALLLAVVFNFTFHHVFTYRHIKHVA